MGVLLVRHQSDELHVSLEELIINMARLLALGCSYAGDQVLKTDIYNKSVIAVLRVFSL